MEKIYNAQLKELYINKYKLNDIFNMTYVILLCNVFMIQYIKKFWN